MALPLHHYMKDLLGMPSDAPMSTQIVFDNARSMPRKRSLHVRSMQRQSEWPEHEKCLESCGRIQKKHALDVSDHTKKDSRWASDLTRCESGRLKLINTSSRQAKALDQPLSHPVHCVHTLSDVMKISHDVWPLERPTNYPERLYKTSTLVEVDEAIAICADEVYEG